ncbi:MAG: type II toxin-antitoxin system HicA family toxin [Syntrophobacteraceae bacterium]
MGRLPILKPREVVSILEKLGFVEVRRKGSHRQYRHSDGRQTTVPFHKRQDISPILLFVRCLTKSTTRHCWYF